MRERTQEEWTILERRFGRLARLVLEPYTAQPRSSIAFIGGTDVAPQKSKIKINHFRDRYFHG